MKDCFFLTKHLWLSLLFLLSYQAVRATGWERIALPDTIVTSLAMTSDHKLFATTVKGIYQSTDGGITWIREQSTATAESWQTFGIVYNEKGSMFAELGDNIYERISSGKWRKLPQQSWMDHIYKILISDEDVLFVMIPSYIYRSTDHGTTWEEVGKDLPHEYRGDMTQSLNGNIYVASSGFAGGSIFRSTDLGLSFAEIISEGNDGGAYIIASTSKSLLIGTVKTGLRRTTTEGDSWEVSNFDEVAPTEWRLPAEGEIVESKGVLYTRKNHFNKGDSSIFLRSFDDGLHWETISESLFTIPEGSGGINSFTINEENDLLIATNDGIYSYSLAEASVNSTHNDHHSTVFYSSGSSSLIIHLQEPQEISLQLYDGLGRAVLHQSTILNSTTSIPLPSHLKSGVYFCSLTSKEGVSTSKFTIVR